MQIIQCSEVEVRLPGTYPVADTLAGLRITLPFLDPGFQANTSDLMNLAQHLDSADLAQNLRSSVARHVRLGAGKTLEMHPVRRQLAQNIVAIPNSTSGISLVVQLDSVLATLILISGCGGPNTELSHVENSQSLCRKAEEYLTTCGASWGVSSAATCTAEQQRVATQLLAMDCRTLEAQGLGEVDPNSGLGQGYVVPVHGGADPNPGQPGPDDQHPDQSPPPVPWDQIDPKLRSELDALERAIQGYRNNPQMAVNDGYAQEGHCVEGMGTHYVKKSRSFWFNHTKPTILLYDGNGKLIGVEWALVRLKMMKPEGFTGNVDRWEFHEASCHRPDGTEYPSMWPACQFYGAGWSWHPSLWVLHYYLDEPDLAKAFGETHRTVSCGTGSTVEPPHSH